MYGIQQKNVCTHYNTRHSGVLLSFAMSIFQMNRDTTITAGILLKQLDNVTQIVQHTTKLTSIMVMKPCKDILEQLIANGALTPYGFERRVL